MGGGTTSRIPALLDAALPDDVKLVVPVYDFDPEKGEQQVRSYIEEYKPDIVVAESLGANHAVLNVSVPLLLVSPALGAPRLFYRLAILSKIPGMTPLFDYIYRPRYEGRQDVHFEYSIMRKWKSYAERVKDVSLDNVHAFIGLKDKKMRSGVVSLKGWKKQFGEDTLTCYKGGHYMEEEFIHSLLVPAILESLG